MCKIIRVLGNGNYIIEILFNYIDYNLYKGNRFNFSLYLFKKCDEKSFKNIMSLNNIGNLSYKNLIDIENDNKISDSEYDDDDDLNNNKNINALILTNNDINDNYFSNEIKKSKSF